MSKEIGDFIRKKRKESNMTLKEVSESAGISYPYLSTLETGKRDNPSAEVLNSIAGVLGISSVDILTIGGYLTKTDTREVSENTAHRWKLHRLTPLGLLTQLSPVEIRDILQRFARRSNLEGKHYEFLNLSGYVLSRKTTKWYVDSLILNHKELLHVYVFLSAAVAYGDEDIPEERIWEWSMNIEKMMRTVEKELGFEAFDLWYKFYFTDNRLANYGDYVVKNGEDYAFEIAPLLNSDTVLLNGKVLNPDLVAALKGFVNSIQ